MPRFLRRLLAPASRRPNAIRRGRPQIERLEDRTTPALINFVPFSAVAANPAPLPATALMQFNPLPDVVALAKADATIQVPVHLQGNFQQLLTSPMAGGGPANGPPIKLVVIYQIDGTVAGSSTAPTAAGPGSLTAHLDLTGKYLATIFVPSAGNTLQPPWTITGTFTEKGDLSGPLNKPSTSATDPISFTATIATNQVERRLSLTGAASVPWSVQSTVQAAGKFQVGTVLPPPPTPLSPIVVTAPFTVQEQIASSLAPIPANGTPPPPPVKITAVDNAAGMASYTLFPSGMNTALLVTPGTTNYLQQMQETISYPPTSTGGGTTVTLGQVFAANGVYVNGSAITPPPPPSDDGGSGLAEDSGASPLSAAS
ncbi:MAG TPA: hypothetical protein VH120_05045 [Gemmataceae bacterium]|nr:hypothetical protein [Gemmataceae bacterium]